MKSYIFVLYLPLTYKRCVCQCVCYLVVVLIYGALQMHPRRREKFAVHLICQAAWKAKRLLNRIIGKKELPRITW